MRLLVLILSLTLICACKKSEDDAAPQLIDYVHGATYIGTIKGKGFYEDAAVNIRYDVDTTLSDTAFASFTENNVLVRIMQFSQTPKNGFFPLESHTYNFTFVQNSTWSDGNGNQISFVEGSNKLILLSSYHRGNDIQFDATFTGQK